MTNIDNESISFLETARFDGNNRQWNMTGGYSYLTDIASVKNGKEKRNAVYFQPKASWEIGNRGVTEKDYQIIASFHYATKGRLIGFRMRDWLDYKDQGFGVLRKTDDSSLNYQMYKKRNIELADVYRLQKITKPIGNTFVSFPNLGNTIQFFWNDSEIFQSTNTANPGTITLDDTTGILSYNPTSLTLNIADGIYTSTTNHGLKVNDGIRFTRDSTVIYTYITSVIDSKNFTVNYSESFTASNVNANPYPTDLSDFSWTGLYDKAVRFDTDNINVTVSIFDDSDSEETKIAVQLPSIQIVELSQ